MFFNKKICLEKNKNDRLLLSSVVFIVFSDIGHVFCNNMGFSVRLLFLMSSLLMESLDKITGDSRSQVRVKFKAYSETCRFLDLLKLLGKNRNYSPNDGEKW